MIKNSQHIDKNLIEKNLTQLLSGEFYVHDEILFLCDILYKDTHGLSYFDVFVIKTFITNLSKKIGRKLNILEIGCGTSSRVMYNLGHNIKTYALSDDHKIPINQHNQSLEVQEYNFNNKNVLDNKNLLINEFDDCDIFFLDGDHSYEFARTIYEDIILKSKNKKPIICHDFLPFSHPHTYGEQVYLVDNFLKQKNGYELFTYTSQELEVIKKINDNTGSDFIQYYNNGYSFKGSTNSPLPISCISIII